MRKVFIALAAVVLVGCASFKTNAYRTVGVITTSAETARSAFIDYCNTHPGKVNQDQFDAVKLVYQDYQTSMRIAQVAFNAYNASEQPDADKLKIALAAAQEAAGDVVTLVCSFLPTKQAESLKSQIKEK